jgi:hypothetical protein
VFVPSDVGKIVRFEHTDILYDALPDELQLSFAFATKVNEPVAEAVPNTNPLELNANPVGVEPEITE